MMGVNGGVVWSAKYSSFGEATVDPAFMVNSNFRFPGQYYDKETGFPCNYHRYYDPRTGRYLRPDPIGLQYEEPDLYAYVLNNPINAIDPLGLKRCGPCEEEYTDQEHFCEDRDVVDPG